MSYQSFVFNFTTAGPGSTPNDIQDVLSAIEKTHTPPITLTSSLAASSTRVIDHPRPLPAPIQRPHPSQIKRSSSPQPLPIIGLGIYLEGEVYIPFSPSNKEENHIFSQPLLPTRRSSPNRIEGILNDDEEEWDSIPARMKVSSHHFDAPPAEDLPIPFFSDTRVLLSESNDSTSEESFTSSLEENSDEDSPTTSEDEDEDEFSFGIDIFSPIPTFPHSYSSTNPICVFVDTTITTITEDLDLAVDSKLDFDSDNVTLMDILYSLQLGTGCHNINQT
ncbi:hypothetical protein C8Q75DRAFT_385790 [Abortiporus biennis]|nr:hypothetical protein C8Q75DRAFT_385790 [Abortiporus biennis]